MLGDEEFKTMGNKRPESIQDILNSAFKGLGLEEKIRKYTLWNHWPEIVGPKIAEKTSPLRVQGNTLVIGVESHAWMNELTLMKSMLLEKIHQSQKDCPIKNLRFELKGKTSNPIG